MVAFKMIGKWKVTNQMIGNKNGWWPKWSPMWLLVWFMFCYFPHWLWDGWLTSMLLGWGNEPPTSYVRAHKFTETGHNKAPMAFHSQKSGRHPCHWLSPSITSLSPYYIGEAPRTVELVHNAIRKVTKKRASLLSGSSARCATMARSIHACI